MRGRISLRDEKTPQIMCNDVYPLDGTPLPAAPAAPGGPRLLEGRRLVIKCPRLDDPVVHHISLLLKMFPGTAPLIMVMADTGKRYAARCLLHQALYEELKEVLGEDCVVLQ